MTDEALRLNASDKVTATGFSDVTSAITANGAGGSLKDIADAIREKKDEGSGNIPQVAYIVISESQTYTFGQDCLCYMSACAGGGAAPMCSDISSSCFGGGGGGGFVYRLPYNFKKGDQLIITIGKGGKPDLSSQSPAPDGGDTFMVFNPPRDGGYNDIYMRGGKGGRIVTYEDRLENIKVGGDGGASGLYDSKTGFPNSPIGASGFGGYAVGTFAERLQITKETVPQSSVLEYVPLSSGGRSNDISGGDGFCGILRGRWIGAEGGRGNSYLYFMERGDSGLYSSIALGGRSGGMIVRGESGFYGGGGGSGALTLYGGNTAGFLAFSRTYRGGFESDI